MNILIYYNIYISIDKVNYIKPFYLIILEYFNILNKVNTFYLIILE